MSSLSHRTVCHRRGGGHFNSRRLPQLDQNEAGVSRAVGANCRLYFVSVWFAEFDTGRNLLFPIDRSLRSIDFDHVSGIFPNHRHRMVLRHSSTIEEYQTNDRKGTVAILQIVLAHRWTIAALCKHIARCAHCVNFHLLIMPIIRFVCSRYGYSV